MAIGGGGMLYKMGRTLQVIGMILLPVGIAGNLYDERRVTLWQSLTISGVGVLVFALGWLLQQWGKPTT